MNKILCLLILTSASSAFASTYSKCGRSVDIDTLETTGYELEISSDNDVFRGAVGNGWNLKLDENGDWLPASRNVTAKSYEDKSGQTIVEVSLIQARTASGPVGIKYKLIGLYDDQPTLEKYNIGGFSGPIKTATFQCVSGND
jgi:hypothetical protein